jgi:hypothetical protein
MKKFDIPNRPALTTASWMFQIVGLMLGIGIIVMGFFTQGNIDGAFVPYYITGAVIIGVVVWINFAIWGELMEVLTTMEEMQIRIVNKLNESDDEDDT